MLSRFLDGNSFNSVSLTSNLLKSGSITDSLNKLSSGLNSLDNELSVQVAAHHEELLTQVNRIRDLEEMLKVVTAGVDNLQTSLDKFVYLMGNNFLLLFGFDMRENK